jgi:hypothetical protein
VFDEATADRGPCNKQGTGLQGDSQLIDEGIGLLLKSMVANRAMHASKQASRAFSAEVLSI